MLVMGRSFNVMYNRHLSTSFNGEDEGSFAASLREKLGNNKTDYMLVLVVPNLNASYGYSKPIASYVFFACMLESPYHDHITYVETPSWL